MQISPTSELGQIRKVWRRQHTELGDCTVLDKSLTASANYECLLALFLVVRLFVVVCSFGALARDRSPVKSLDVAVLLVCYTSCVAKAPGIHGGVIV